MVKKKSYDVDDPETWSDAQMNKYIVDSVKDIGLVMPWKEIALSALFTYGYWKAYGAGPLPTKEDVLLGVFHAMTIPPALQGGIIANAYAVGLLSTLGIGLMGGDIAQKMADRKIKNDELKKLISDENPSFAEEIWDYLF